MRTVAHIFDRARTFKGMILSAGVLVLAAAGGIAVANLISPQQGASAARCSNNDIIRCGANSAGEFINKYNQNATGDLPAIFSHYGLDVNKLHTNAVAGTAHKDGRIVVGGKTVATGAYSLGRSKKYGDAPVNIAGRTYWQGANQTAFASASLPIIAIMEGDHFVSGFILACANPIQGVPVFPKPEPPKPQPPKPQPPKPVAECTGLTAQMVDRTKFKFNVSYNLKHATLKSITYVVKDANGKEVSRSSNDTYTQTKPGKYTVEAHLVATMDGKDVNLAVDNCKTTFEVKEEDKDIVVCRLEDKKYPVTIKASEFDKTKHSTNVDDCKKEVPVVPVPSTPKTPLPKTGAGNIILGSIGVGALTTAIIAYVVSRRTA